MNRLIEIDDVRQILESLVAQYKVPFVQSRIGNSCVFEVVKFGTRVIYLDGQLFDRKTTEGWHIAWVHPDYSIDKSKEIIIWTLVHGGYFHYIRTNYKRTFQQMIQSGWDRKIIAERKRVHTDPKFNYFNEVDADAWRESGAYILAIDPGFFDFIVE
jgi:hypothetical protein